MDYTGIIGARGSGKTTLLTVIVGLVHLNYFDPKKKNPKGIALSSHHKVDFQPMWELVRKMFPKANLEESPEVYYMPNNLRRIDLNRLHHKIIFWDDLQNLFDLRLRDAVPPEIRLFLASVRHYHSQIVYTTPSWSRADKDLRLGTGRLLRVTRAGRLLFASESRVVPDENDPLGGTLIVRRVGAFPHMIWLPFDPEDQMFPLHWGKMRRIAKYVGAMFDSWAHVEVGEHVAEARGEKKPLHGRSRPGENNDRRRSDLDGLALVGSAVGLAGSGAGLPDVDATIQLPKRRARATKNPRRINL